MPIPVRRVDISLSRATPSALTPEKLRKQLKAIGLDCDKTEDEDRRADRPHSRR